MEDDRDLEAQEHEEEAEDADEEGLDHVENAMMRFLRRLADEDQGWVRLAGVGITMLGGVLILISGFVVQANVANSYSGTEVYVSNKGLILFGIAVVIGAFLALLWRVSYVGPIFPLVISGLIIFEITGWLLSFNTQHEGMVYLTFGGSLLALLGSLICLAQRRTGLVERLDLQDRRISALDGVVGSLLDVWEEADRLAEAHVGGEEPSLAVYDNAALRAEQSLQDYREEFE